VSQLHNSKLLPDYITAESPRGLRLLMLKTNAKFGATHKFFDISQFTDKKGKRKFIAWFYRSVEKLEDFE
jgi:hypothetical protein